MPEALKIERISLESEFRKKQTERMSVVLGITAAMGTMMVALTTIIDKPEVSSPLKDLIGITLPTITVLASVMVATAAMLVSVRLKRARQDNTDGVDET